MNCITITFGDQAENHAGMQKIGELKERGLSILELKETKAKFEKLGATCELVRMSCEDEKAAVLIVRDGVSYLVGDADEMYEEHKALKPDTKAKMYGRVVNKNARYNLCFDDESQEPEYEEGKGTIVSWDDVPLTAKMRRKLPKFFGDLARDLKAEGNYYYDIKKCGIGYHGDAERRIVIAARLGKSIPLHYHWFYKSKPVGETIEIKLEHGDLYAMSSKAVGFDWKLKNTYTLRHAAGCAKFLKVEKPKPKPKKEVEVEEEDVEVEEEDVEEEDEDVEEEEKEQSSVDEEAKKKIREKTLEDIKKIVKKRKEDYEESKKRYEQALDILKECKKDENALDHLAYNLVKDDKEYGEEAWKKIRKIMRYYASVDQINEDELDK